MITPETMGVRRKILGVVLRSARLAEGRTQEDCAQVLQSPSDLISQYERGEADISLPELEALAKFLHVPPLDLLAADMSSLPTKRAPRSPKARLLRSKVIGALLRHARQNVGVTTEEVEAHLGCPPGTLALYETGQNDVPVLQLQAVAEFLGMPFSHFLELPVAEEKRSVPPPTPSLRAEQAPDEWAHVPPEVKEFLAAPRNMPYVQVAMELSRLSPQGLRAIAEALLAAQSPESS